MWGLSYLHQCVLLLLAPGVPVVFEYSGSGGKYEAKADSYAVDLQRREATFYGVRLTTDTGREVVQANQVRARLIGPGIDVLARGLRGEVLRDRNGQFELFGALPESTPGQPGPAYQVEVTDAELNYRDLSQQPPLSLPLRIQSLQLAGSGSKLLSSGDVTAGDSSAARVKVQIGEEGQYWVQASQPEGPLDPWLKVARGFIPDEVQREYDRAGARSVEGFFELEASGRPEETPRVRGAFQARVSAIRVPGISGESGAEASAFGTLDLAQARMTIRNRGSVGTFDGRIGFADKLLADGRVQASVSSDGALEKGIVPRGFRFSGASYDGRLVINGQDVGLDGEAKAKSMQFQGESFANLVARVGLSDSRLSVTGGTGSWTGVPFKAAALADLSKQTIVGGLEAGSVPLGLLAKRAGFDGLSGSAGVKAVLRGTLKRPILLAYAEGRADYAPKGSESLNLGRFQVQFKSETERIRIDRLFVDGPVGTFVAHGALDAKGAEILVRAGGLPLSLIDPDLDGTGSFAGVLRGSPDRPRFEGMVEAVAVDYRGRSVAQAQARLSVDAERVQVDEFWALTGSGIAEAGGSLDLRTRRIEGEFQVRDLLMGHWAGPNIVGPANLEHGRVSGSLDDPVVTAKLTSQQAFVFGTPVERTSVTARYEGGVMRWEGTMSMRYGGSLSHDGEWDTASESAKFKAEFESLNLESVASIQGPASIGGAASGRVSGEWDPSQGLRGTGEARLSSVIVNGEPIGNGSLALQMSGPEVLGTAMVGSTDRFLEIDSFTINAENLTYRGTGAAFNVSLQKLLATATRRAGLDIETQSLLQDLNGSITGEAVFSGEGADWQVNEGDLVFEGLTFRGSNAGSVTVKGSKAGPMWSVDSLTWDSPEGSLTASGLFDEKGAEKLEATVTNLSLSWIHRVFPNLPLVNGRATVSATGSGPWESLAARGTALLSTESLVQPDGSVLQLPLQILADELALSNGDLTAQGKLYFRGFSGGVSARLPIAGLTELDEEKAARLEVAFDRRSVSDLEEFLPAVDVGKSEGHADLRFGLRATRGSVSLVGDANFVAKTLVLKDDKGEWRDVNVNVGATGTSATVMAQAESARGGSVTAELRAAFQDVLGESFSVNNLLSDTSLAGTVSIDRLNVAQSLALGALPPNAVQPKASTAQVSGEISIGGVGNRPVVSGELRVSEAIVNLPDEFGSPSGQPLAIDPVFDNLTIVAANDSVIATAIGPLTVGGVGVLKGPVSQLDVDWPLTLQRGELRLPNNRIRLEPGGTIRIGTQSLAGGGPTPRVDLDLEGRTQIVARSGTGQYEAYRIDLTIRGNLLDDASVRIKAASDPPGLSEGEILAAIGQRQLVEGLASSVIEGRIEQDFLRDTFYSVAVPSLTQRLTDSIAEGLGLDFLSVDYNPFEQFVVSVGKTLAPGLVLQATRQLQDTGLQRIRYDVRLSYRLPTSDRRLRRFRVGLGFDQDSPWKITLDWSTRF